MDKLDANYYNFFDLGFQSHIFGPSIFDYQSKPLSFITPVC